MSVRTRTLHEEILIKLDLRNWTAVPRTVRRIQNTVEMHCDTRQNHLGTTFSITLGEYLQPHELTFPTTSQVDVHASENSVDPTTKRYRHKETRWARQLYNSNGQLQLQSGHTLKMVAPEERKHVRSQPMNQYC